MCLSTFGLSFGYEAEEPFFLLHCCRESCPPASVCFNHWIMALSFCQPMCCPWHTVLISVNSLHPTSIICLRTSVNGALNRSDFRKDSHVLYCSGAEITSFQTPFQMWQVQLTIGCFEREGGFLQRLPPYNCVLLCFVLFSLNCIIKPLGMYNQDRVITAY